MDFFAKKELESLKNDIKSKEIAVEADKYAFETKLLNGLGESMMNDLKNPPKHNWFTSIKVKYAKWKKVRKEKQEYKKRIGDF
jgi:hypothetical protein